MSTQFGALRFLPWLRTGFATAIGETPSGGTDGRPSATVTLNVRHEEVADPHADTLEPVPTTIRLYGPGDVAQLNPAQVIATDPKPFANDFEPNYLASVTLDAPELPWLFSPEPTPSGEAARLKPWLCLVVVSRDAAKIVVDAGRPLPTLELADASGELPDLTESWAWAHAQITGTASVGSALSGPPERTLARLICPRRLEAGTAYVACVVPVFAAGRQAGLGEKVTARHELAWDSPAGGDVELPIYYQWEFSTATAGDFEALVRRLEPRPLPPEIGRRPLDVSSPGPGLPETSPGAPGSVLGLEGALRSPAMQPSAGPSDDFKQRLEAQLEKAPGEAESVVTPPIYGDVHAGVTSVPDEGVPPVWVRDLNLDPRHRAAAGFGVRVVQEQQEQLVASAWDQVGEVARANQLLREAQLARAVAGSVREKRLTHLPPEIVLRVTEPAHARVPAVSDAESVRALPQSLLGLVRESVFPEAAVSAPFRRALRPLGSVGRQLGEAPIAELVTELADGTAQMPISPVIGGTVRFNSVRLDELDADVPQAKGWRTVADFGDGVETEPDVEPEPGVAPPEAPTGTLALALQIDDPDLPTDHEEPKDNLPRQSRLRGINRRFRAAADELGDYLADSTSLLALAAEREQLDLGDVASQLVDSGGLLDPEDTVPAGVLPLIQLPDDTRPAEGDKLAPIEAAPSFPQPMYEPLRALSQDALLPGVEHVLPDTIGLLEGNPRFIEAYMVGLNDELRREFLWRGLPAEPRATCFRQFWDIRGREPDAAGEPTDIPPVVDWEPKGGLGENATRVGGRDMLVLLIRGELMRRYPTATIYAVEAAGPETLGEKELHPEFRGTLEPDLVFVGFGLSVATARGTGDDPGWFFVIQQQATEPRFGFDEPDGTYGGVAPTLWRDLTWGHLVESKPAFEALEHVSVESNRLRGTLREGATWGMNSAHMAQVALQLPVRVAVHGSRLLPPVHAVPTRITAVKRARRRISAVGGVDQFGERWRLTAEEAIAAIRGEARSFYVEQPTGDPVDVVVARRRGRDYLKTTADGDAPNNLLALPELTA